MAKKQPRDPAVPQRIPEGFLFSDVESAQSRPFFFLIFGIFWNTVSVIILVASLHEAEYQASLMMLFFLAFGLPILGLGLLEVWKNYRLHPAELILPNYPLRLGETFTIRYRRRLRKGTFARSAQLEAQLLCDEWVQYKQGTDTVTKTHPIWEKAFPPQTVVSGERQADYLGKISIRPQGPPSIFAEHNKIRWQLVIKLRASGIPSDCISTFVFNVLPESIATP
jgi:hypothetical protein